MFDLQETFVHVIVTKHRKLKMFGIFQTDFTDNWVLMSPKWKGERGSACVCGVCVKREKFSIEKPLGTRFSSITVNHFKSVI